MANTLPCSFFLVSILRGGNIACGLKCQETHSSRRRRKRLCILLLWLFPLLAASGRFRRKLLNSSPDTNAPSARVLIVEDSLATDELEPVPEKIRLMVDRGLTNLTGKPTARAAWLSLVSTNDTVGLKVFSSPGANSGTRPSGRRRGHSRPD